ncbi:MAG TPA: inositol monophosphatase family protein [Bdellovibrionales bacterium]|nr:inositol monophosphatase family protein [Bdellovibrionales bacterium]
MGRYLAAAQAAANDASKVLDSHFGHLRNVEEKYQAGLVSDADREAEKAIVGLLKKTFPDHAFLGEEYGSSGSDQDSGRSVGSPLWIIDPLDGTTNFIHQFPMFCISIALEIDGELQVGVVDAPKLGVRFHAVRGGGAFATSGATGKPQPIHVSTRSEMKDGLFATGFSSYDNTLDEQLELLARIVRHTRGIRRAGAAALDLCMVASGVFDCFWEKNLAPWDTAAGVLIAREAGGIATDMDGREFNPRMKSVLCGNPTLHDETLRIMKEIAKRKGRNWPEID